MNNKQRDDSSSDDDENIEDIIMSDSDYSYLSSSENSSCNQFNNLIIFLN